MKPIYAVCISAAQGSEPGQVSASLTYKEDGRDAQVHLHWDLPTVIEAEGVVSEWLYSVLSRVVQDFDDHVIDYVAMNSDGTKGEKQDV